MTPPPRILAFQSLFANAIHHNAHKNNRLSSCRNWSDCRWRLLEDDSALLFVPTLWEFLLLLLSAQSSVQYEDGGPVRVQLKAVLQCFLAHHTAPEILSAHKFSLKLKGFDVSHKQFPSSRIQATSVRKTYLSQLRVTCALFFFCLRSHNLASQNTLGCRRCDK